MSIETLPNVELRSSSLLEPKVNNRWYDRMRSENRHEDQKRKHTEALLKVVVIHPTQEQHQLAIVAEVVNQENTNTEAALEKDLLHCYNTEMLALIAAKYFNALQSDAALKTFFVEKLEAWVKSSPTLNYAFFAILATPKTENSAPQTEKQKINYGIACIQSFVSDELTTSGRLYPTLQNIKANVAAQNGIDTFTFSAKQCEVHQAVQKTSILGILFSGNWVFSKESAFIREKVEATGKTPRFTPEELLYIAANPKLRNALKAELQRKTWSGQAVVNKQSLAGDLEEHFDNLLSDRIDTRTTTINNIKQLKYPVQTAAITIIRADESDTDAQLLASNNFRPIPQDNAETSSDTMIQRSLQGRPHNHDRNSFIERSSDSSVSMSPSEENLSVYLTPISVHEDSDSEEPMSPSKENYLIYSSPISVHESEEDDFDLILSSLETVNGEDDEDDNEENARTYMSPVSVYAGDTEFTSPLSSPKRSSITLPGDKASATYVVRNLMNELNASAPNPKEDDEEIIYSSGRTLGAPN